MLVTGPASEIVEQARRTLDDAEKIKAVARRSPTRCDGPLRLGVIHTIAPYLLPDLVAELR